MKILAAAKLNNLEIEIADYQHMMTNRTPEFLAKFPAGKVPAFEGSDGLCLAESDAIAQYIAQSGPCASQLLGQDPATSALIRQWISFTDGEIVPYALDLVIWRVNLGPYDETTEKKALARIEYALGVLEKHLDGRTWLVGDQLTLADLTLASALVWPFMHIVDEAMRERYSKVVSWYLRTIGMKGVKDVFGSPDMISVRRTYTV